MEKVEAQHEREKILPSGPVNSMSTLLPPHGSSELKPLLLESEANHEPKKKLTD
jgi:hypothetical protein